jgi:hypothetical protein
MTEPAAVNATTPIAGRGSSSRGRRESSLNSKYGFVVEFEGASPS